MEYYKFNFDNINKKYNVVSYRIPIVVQICPETLTALGRNDDALPVEDHVRRQLVLAKIRSATGLTGTWFALALNLKQIFGGHSQILNCRRILSNSTGKNNNRIIPLTFYNTFRQTEWIRFDHYFARTRTGRSSPPRCSLRPISICSDALPTTAFRSKTPWNATPNRLSARSFQRHHPRCSHLPPPT